MADDDRTVEGEDRATRSLLSSLWAKDWDSKEDAVYAVYDDYDLDAPCPVCFMPPYNPFEEED